MSLCDEWDGLVIETSSQDMSGLILFSSTLDQVGNCGSAIAFLFGVNMYIVFETTSIIQ